MPSANLSDLDDAQREAVTTDAAPLCILAGAGSGKTRVLTRRIAYRIDTGAADAPHVLALTFSRKAAGELRHRLGALGVRDQVVAGTFHAVAYAQLRQRWEDRRERAPALLESKLRLLGPIVRRHARSAAVQAVDVAAEIEWAKARLVPPQQYEIEAGRMGRTPPMDAAKVAACYEDYELEKRRRGVVDFDDLLGHAARAFDEDDEFAAGQRWRFRHVFVDEFQDVNPAQFRLLQGWVGGRQDLCVVGDPNQAIYSWNGADPRLLDSFERLFPGATVVRLDHNYRSTPQILAAGVAVLGAAGARLEARAADGDLPTVRSYASETAEARGVAARIRREHRATQPWSSFAVLVRTNAQALAFKTALDAAQVPCRVRGAGRFLDQPEVIDALGALDRLPAAVPFADRIADVDAMAAGDEGTDERRANLEELARLAREYAALDVHASVTGFTPWLKAALKGDEADGPGDGDGDAVEVVTFHRAKGLEWPVVFVCGLERGLVPIGRADSEAAEAEERRLLYVAITRARQQLHCSWAERRTFGESVVTRSPSPWLAAIEDAMARLAGGDASMPADRDNIRTMIDRERRKLRSGSRSANGGARSGRRFGAAVLGSEPDPAVFEALKVWRSQAARAANVPAHVIFHDTTLAAVAELRPTTPDALLDIPGLGPVKAARYGEALLRVVAEHGRPA